MKKIIFLLLCTVTIYGQTLQNPTYGTVKLKTNTATAETSKIVSQQPTTGELNYVNATALPVSIAVQDSLDGKISKNSTPETKIGGLTLGVNLANAGDSWLTFGTSVTNQALYSTPTAAQLNLTLVNYGVSGSDSGNLASQYANIPTWTTSYRLLSVEHSINDSAHAVSLVTFRSNLEAFIVNAKSKGWANNRILVINGNYCTTAPMITTLESYANEAMAVAKEQGVQYYDAYNYTKNNGAGALLSDGVHPSTAGGLVYARGLIASMQGGMEITNGLTIDNGLVVNGIINSTKKISTLGSIQTGDPSGNTPSNTVNGDVIVPYTAGITTQYSQTGIISRFSPLELYAGGFKSVFRNYVENGGFSFLTSGGTRGNQILAMNINTNGVIDTPFGINSAEHINIGYAKEIRMVAGWTNKLTISEGSGHTSISNGYAGGEINFNVSNGVTNASNLALKISANKDFRSYGNATFDGNLNIIFDKYIGNSGTSWVNKLMLSSASGHTSISNGYSGGNIDFNVSDGVTNASNLAFRINNNRSLTLSATPTTSAGTYDILTRNTSTGVVEKIASSIVNILPSNNTFTGENTFSNYTIFGAPAKLKNYTVATLPEGNQGDIAFVTDALAPTYLTTVVGGGAVVTPVFYDGVSWKCH